MKFFSDISLWLLIPWGILSVTVAVLYYRKQKQTAGISQWIKRALVTLRAAGIFLLGLLLFGILLETSESKVEKPIFITLVDNSSSMLNYKDSGDVKAAVSEFDKKLKDQYGDRFDLKTYYIDAEVADEGNGFKGAVSNLDRGVDHIYNQYYNRNIGGICFISDGNYNKGNSPVYTAEKISLTPFFTVGVGDTVRKKDHLIRNVAANDIAFFKNKFPIEVDIEANKMGKVGCQLELYKGSQKIASETLQYSGEEIDFQHVTLLVEADQVGFVNYTLRLTRMDGESSYENNERSIYVEIIDSRSKVLMLATAPHPDVTAVKQVLDKDENLEVESELLNKWDGNLEGVELIIFHGAGESNTNVLLDKARSSRIPVFFFVTGDAKRSEVENLGIGLTLPNDHRLDEVQGYIAQGFNLFELSDKVETLLKKAPPVHVKFGNIKAEGGTTLIAQRLGQVTKKDPVLYFGKNARFKFGVFAGEGLWRWKLSEYGRVKNNDGFNELIQKTVQYLVVKKNTEPLRINLPKRFNISDEIYINAEFYNSALEPIVTPEINFKLTDEGGKSIPYVFAKNARDYRLSLGKLQAGKYTWEATTEFDGKKYRKEGVFIVEAISLEALSTSADHNLLKTIADRSNGKFYTLSEMDQLLKDIGNRKDIVNISYEETDYNDLIDWKWIFFVVIFLFGAEWFIRRYSGTY